MTYNTTYSDAARSNFDLGELNSRLNPSARDIYLAVIAMRREAAEVLQAKHRRGKELAHGAIAYLYGGVDQHETIFQIGSEDCQLAAQAQELHEGYEAHFRYLDRQGVITTVDEDGLYVAYGTGRMIQRTYPEPGLVVYRDSESQRAIEIANNDLTRLIAGA